MNNLKALFFVFIVCYGSEIFGKSIGFNQNPLSLSEDFDSTNPTKNSRNPRYTSNCGFNHGIPSNYANNFGIPSHVHMPDIHNYGIPSNIHTSSNNMWPYTTNYDLDENNGSPHESNYGFIQKFHWPVNEESEYPDDEYNFPAIQEDTGYQSPRQFLLPFHHNDFDYSGYKQPFINHNDYDEDNFKPFNIRVNINSRPNNEDSMREPNVIYTNIPTSGNNRHGNNDYGIFGHNPSITVSINNEAGYLGLKGVPDYDFGSMEDNQKNTHTLSHGPTVIPVLNSNEVPSVTNVKTETSNIFDFSTTTSIPLVIPATSILEQNTTPIPALVQKTEEPKIDFTNPESSTAATTTLTPTESSTIFTTKTGTVTSMQNPTTHKVFTETDTSYYDYVIPQ